MIATFTSMARSLWRTDERMATRCFVKAWSRFEYFRPEDVTICHILAISPPPLPVLAKQKSSARSEILRARLSGAVADQASRVPADVHAFLLHLRRRGFQVAAVTSGGSPQRGDFPLRQPPSLWLMPPRTLLPWRSRPPSSGPLSRRPGSRFPEVDHPQ